MAGQQGQPKYGFGWPDGHLGGLGPPGSMTPGNNVNLCETDISGFPLAFLLSAKFDHYFGVSWG